MASVSSLCTAFSARDYHPATSEVPQVLFGKLLSIAVSYSMGPSALVDEFESLAMARSWMDGALTEARVESLAGEMQRAFAKRAAARGNVGDVGFRTPAIKAPRDAAVAMPDSAAPVTPAPASAATPAHTGAGASPLTPEAARKLLDGPGGNSAFATRSDKGKEIARLGATAASPTAAPSTSVRNATAEPARFMYERLEDRANALSNRVRRFAERVCPANVKLDPVGAARQSLVRVVGRVCVEVEGANGGRINENSMLIEGDVEVSQGARVKLDVSGIDKVSLFQGQVVYVEGYNLSGFTLVATKLVACVEAMPEEVVKEEAGGAAEEDDTPMPQAALPAPKPACCPGGARIAVAAGPFTCSCDSAYEPLDALLGQFDGDDAVDVLVLVGPFVDAEHPSVAGNALPVTFEELFAAKPRALIEEFVDMHPNTTVVVVPSVRDVTEAFVFPQPAMAEAALEGVVAAPNPADLDVSGMRLSVCSVDVLKHMAGAELGRGFGTGADRMARLATHIVAQRTSYPLFPTPKFAATTLPLDLSLAEAHATLDQVPDVLLLPSDLAPFAKAVDASAVLPVGVAGAPLPPPTGEGVPFVAVNPGRVARGTGGGSYARLTVAPASGSGEAAPLAERVEVRIVRV